MTVQQTTLKGKPVDAEKPWADVCSSSCWKATDPRCRCKCHGKHHGKGTLNKLQSSGGKGKPSWTNQELRSPLDRSFFHLGLTTQKES